MNQNKKKTYDFWNAASCGENLYLSDVNKLGYENQSKIRYQLEPYISGFADFENSEGLRILEIGVGMGADHQSFAQAGADIYGIDLTERAVEYTRHRLEVFGLAAKCNVGDAEDLDFEDELFDRVYSWGVLHHSPDTPKAIEEVRRVLKPGGVAKIMIYHKWSLVGFMLWVRYALFALKPWRSLNQVYANYLESPGTKAYSVAQANQLFAGFDNVEIRTIITHADLLESQAGQLHEGTMLILARKFWPRALLKRFFPKAGLFMLIEAKKLDVKVEV